jgi:hypothetical protein
MTDLYQSRRNISMKLNLKAIAAAAALLAAGTSANAAIQSGADGSLILAAYNQVTKSYYIRDTGFTINSFLPSDVTTAPGDGGVVGNKTPEAGLTLDKTNTPGFASDATFASWISGQTLSDIRWTLFATDNSSAAGTNNVSRFIVASSSTTPVVTNNTVSNTGTISNGYVGINGSATGATAASQLESNLGVGSSTLSTLDTASSLFYFARTVGTLANSTVVPNNGGYNNSLFAATITLESDGDLVYSLASAQAPSEVPLPAAAWLLGSGLLGLGAARRRKAAKQA